MERFWGAFDTKSAFHTGLAVIVAALTGITLSISIMASARPVFEKTIAEPLILRISSEVSENQSRGMRDSISSLYVNSEHSKEVIAEVKQKLDSLSVAAHTNNQRVLTDLARIQRTIERRDGAADIAREIIRLQRKGGE